jgi:hypothetical protein
MVKRQMDIFENVRKTEQKNIKIKMKKKYKQKTRQ